MGLETAMGLDPQLNQYVQEELYGPQTADAITNGHAHSSSSPPPPPPPGLGAQQPNQHTLENPFAHANTNGHPHSGLPNW